MKRPLLGKVGIYSLLLLIGSVTKSAAQSPGFIVKPATGTGQSILDPNLDGLTSVSTNGFSGNDVDSTKTEIKFRTIKPLNYEGTGDLLRGPSGGFSDLVTAVDSSGSYVYSSGSRLYFRLRVGDFIAGSKGYSILIDADGKMGYTGPMADPGYTAPANGLAGNPGFEYEISFQTNFRVAVYNTDTAGKVVLKHSNLPVTDFSQVSVALSYTSGNADYFYDFYVPFSQLGINANTPLRFAVTTVMAPQPALGGPMSDIYGMGNVTDYMDAWTKIINYQTPTTPGSNNPVTLCTPPPTVNAPTVGSTSVSGTWTRLDASKPSTAKVFLYRDGLLIDSVTTTSGNSWSIPVSNILAGTTFYARAKASTEGDCFQSSSVISIKCIGTPSARPNVTCQSDKGVDGNFSVANSRIRVYQNVAPGASGVAAFTLFADSAGAPTNFSSVTAPFVLHDNSSRTWKSDGMNGNGQPSNMSNSACAGGTVADMPANLAITAQEPGKCESMPLFICITGTQTATPSISATTLYPGSVISGTTVPNGYVRLYVDSVLRGAAYADASGNYSFPSAGLVAGNRVDVFAQGSSATCVSSSAIRTVQCFTTPPVLTTDKSGFLTLGATSISGTSSEANGTTVNLYKRTSGATTLVGQTTVLNGTWTVSPVPATTGNEVYMATQQSPCGAGSDTSNRALVPAAVTTSCVAIGTSTFAANSPAISGSVSPALNNGVVYLYIDGALADSAVAVTNTFTVPTNTTPFNKLYVGATISLTAKTSGGAEKLGCGSASMAFIMCSPIQTPSLTLTPAIINANGTTIAGVSNAVSGLLYTLIGSPDNGTSYAKSAFAAGTAFSMTSYPFVSAGTYPLALRVVNLNEGSGCMATSTPATLTVTSVPLPVHLVYFMAKSNQQFVDLKWSAAEEKNLSAYLIERSSDAKTFSTVSEVAASGNEIGQRTYTHQDKAPLAGNSWYRLKMRNNNGSFDYSPVVEVERAISIATSAVTPNPFYGSFTITMKTATSAHVEIRLVDMTGKSTIKRAYQLDAGSHSLLIPELSGLTTGTYLVEVFENGRKSFAQRVQKL